MTISVVGHSNPDTDSVTSAISYACLLKAQGKDAKACMQSQIERQLVRQIDGQTKEQTDRQKTQIKK